MQVSEQIIAVFDDLAQRFGVAIDWGQKNVVPYIQQLCAKYITYEIVTSIIWICFSPILFIAGYIFLKSAIKWHNAHKEEWDYAGLSTAMFAIATAVCWIIALGIVTTNVLDIVRCCIFPELQIFEFIQSQISATK